MTRPVGRPAGPAGTGSLCVLVASVLWGTTGTAASFAPDVGPLAIGAAAMGLGGLLQALLAGPRIARETPALRAQRGVVVLGALAVAAYPSAFYTSMHLAGVAVGTVVSIGSAPLASAVIERVVDGRRLTRRWTTGAVLGLAGTALLCVAEAAGATGTVPGAGVHSARTIVLGVLLGLVAGFAYALYSWAAHRLISRDVTSGAAMGAVFGLGGLLLLPVLATTGAPLLASWSNAAVGAYMALVPMFAGYVLFGWGLAHIPASTATTLSLLEPAVAAVLAVLVVGERLPLLGWAGIALVLACLAVLTTPTRRTPKTPTRRTPKTPTRTVPKLARTAPAERDTAGSPPGRRGHACAAPGFPPDTTPSQGSEPGL
ncbi:DMT family transporter [Streptomyces rishiriensis]|uniref:DMT family transporter n=1 Tax=Streptomyces rishiriensis TaxID=68264 RepID=UPI002481EAEC|nr:DMT family transporter [Streptomyces rishiriensis]